MNTFINTAKIKSDARDLLKGHYGAAIVVALALFTATSLFAYLQTLIQVVFGMVDIESGTYIIDLEQGLTPQLSLGLAAMLICALANFVFTSPLNIGVSRYFFNFASGKSPRVEEIFTYLSSFKMFGRALALSIRIAFLKIIWGILLILPGVAVYAYGIYISGVDISLLLSGQSVTVTDATALSFMSIGSTLLLVGSFLYMFISARYFLANYILASDDEISAKVALSVAVRMIKGRVWQYIFLVLSFFGWILLSILTCGILLLFTVPYMYVTYALYAKTVIDINLNPPPFFQPTI